VRYLDTSAFLKLLVLEEHSSAVAADTAGSDLWSSTLLAVEAHRAALRLGIPASDVDEVLDEVSLVLPAASTFHLAQSVGIPVLRTLDALHLATALEIGAEVEAVVTYDRRLATAVATAGMTVRSPGLPEGWWSSQQRRPRPIVRR
jgi:uncharacterized protein